MSEFPQLKTGAIIQFPARRTTQFATDVIQFLDGSEQRFRDYAAPLHRWIVRLDLLDETEVENVRTFLEQQNGAAGVFSFTDPWDGADYPHCSFEEPGITDSLTGPMAGRTSFTIRENR